MGLCRCPTLPWAYRSRVAGCRDASWLNLRPPYPPIRTAVPFCDRLRERDPGRRNSRHLAARAPDRLVGLSSNHHHKMPNFGLPPRETGLCPGLSLTQTVAASLSSDCERPFLSSIAARGFDRGKGRRRSGQADDGLLRPPDHRACGGRGDPCGSGLSGLATRQMKNPARIAPSGAASGNARRRANAQQHAIANPAALIPAEVFDLGDQLGPHRHEASPGRQT